MPAYHIHFIIGQDGVERPSEVLDCADDFEAISKARQLIDAHDIELREGDRIVANFPRKGTGGLNVNFRLPQEMPPQETKH